jgi:hypothetical protein
MNWWPMMLRREFISFGNSDKGNYHFPGTNWHSGALLTWAEWDRLVAWVAYRRADQEVGKAAKL